MRVITAPLTFDIVDGPQDPCLFLAGGISNCPEWQLDLACRLGNYDITIFNPRRERFNDPTDKEHQIQWEFEYLYASDAIAFWFAEGESVQPLYELGRWTALDEKRIFVGIHPSYAHRANVEIQIPLARPDLKIVYSLDDLERDIKTWYDDYVQI